MAKFLQNKIGYIGEDGKSYGMCADHLKTCQAYTFDEDGEEYMPDNRVIKEYLQRTLTKIKVAQDNLLAEHAEECITDVTKCLQNNNYDWENGSSPKSNIAVNACKAQITTCMSVNGAASTEPTPASMREWVHNTQVIYVSEDSLQQRCESSGGTFNMNNYECKCPNLSINTGSSCDPVDYAELTNDGFECIDGYTASNKTCVAEKDRCVAVNLQAKSGDTNAETIYYHLDTNAYHSNSTCTSKTNKVSVPKVPHGSFEGYCDTSDNCYVDAQGYFANKRLTAGATLTAKIECDSGYTLSTITNTCILNTVTGGEAVNPDLGDVEREDFSAGDVTKP